VRLAAQPVRTDLDLDLADAGTLRLDGSIGRTTDLNTLPVQLTLSWHDSQLGQASRLLSGQDQGWRGELNMDGSLTGTLQSLALKLKIHIDNLRRTEFTPVSSPSLDASCQATYHNGSVAIDNLLCLLPTPPGHLLLTGSIPSWAQDPAYGSFADKAPPRDLRDWYDFCSRVAERYGSVVDFYEVWNEPGWDRDGEAYRNFGVYHFGGQVETDYLPLLQLAQQAVKEKDPEGIVVCGDFICTNNEDPNRGTELFSLLFDEFGRPGQDVSLKVEADAPIVAERPMYFNYQGSWAGGHDSLGTDSPKDKWYFAEGCTRPGFHTWLCLQNPNKERAEITIDYLCGDGNNVQKKVFVEGESRYTIPVHDPAEGIGVHDNSHGDVSIRVTSELPIVAERPMYFNYQGCWAGGHDSLGTDSPKKEWYFAEGCTRPGFHTWLCLQNPNPQRSEVTIDYLCGDGNNVQKKVFVEGESRYTISVHDPAEGIGVHDNSHGDVSIRVTSELPIVAERPMYFAFRGLADGHDSLGADSPKERWYFAEGCTGYSIQEYLCLQNPNPQRVSVTVTCMMQKGETLLRRLELPPSSRTTVDLNYSLGFHGCSDMVAVHPYKAPKDWGRYYANVVSALRARGAYQEAVVSEVGWPHYSDSIPTGYSPRIQEEALTVGIQSLLDNGCRKIWVYQLMDEDPGTSWDALYFGLFNYLGVPFPAWEVYKRWQQSRFPSYPNLPPSLP